MEKKEVFLIGGTGRTGKHLINKLLDKGYDVTALTRNIEKSEKVDNAKFNWIEGDIMKPDTYKHTLNGKVAVVSSLGARKGSPDDLYSTGYKQLLEEMDKNNVKRLIAVTADGDHPNHSWFFKWVVKPLMIGKPIYDMEKFEKYLLNEYKGNVKYTIVRPYRLLEGENENYRVGKHKEVMKPEWTWKSHTGDVADFCVKALVNESHLNSLMSIGQ